MTNDEGDIVPGRVCIPEDEDDYRQTAKIVNECILGWTGSFEENNMKPRWYHWRCNDKKIQIDVYNGMYIKYVQIIFKTIL